MKVFVTAYLNQGRWVADCPKCTGAEIVKADRPFACLSRVNDGFHGETVPCGFTAEVLWPEEKEVIEHLMLKRPITNRNWQPGETLEQLRDDNIAHGLMAGVLLAQ